MKWSDILPKIRVRIEARQRLTLRQGEALYEQYLALQQENERLQQTLRQMERDHGWMKDYAQELVEKWNGMVHMLDRVLDCHVQGAMGKAFDKWQAEYDGKQVTAPSIPAVYEAVIRDRLASEPRQVFRQGYGTVPAHEELEG